MTLEFSIDGLIKSDYANSVKKTRNDKKVNTYPGRSFVIINSSILKEKT